MYPRHPPTLKLPVLVFLLFAVAISAQDKPPAATVRPVVDEYFDQTITDPYRWIGDQKSEEISKWMTAQADYTGAYLDRLPLREELAKH